ncbi:11748_t:CDS:2, partial [Gigaspora margarita]
SDEDKLASAIKKSSVNKEELQRIDLISKIKELPDKEIAPANCLISLMRYSKGPNKGDIISPYLQQKMHNHLVQTLYKRHNTHKFLKESNLRLQKENKKLDRKIRHLLSQFTDEEFCKKVKSVFKADKKNYTSNTIWLAAKISQ